ncbi:hypothetical protein QVD99_006355 [Batrachochytrium dendrobatidis]|nr:hypothetical protein O5D80_003301 [Batrachochytrium dendrobatidis]KAK5667145.1 hypothetical protein QVD99_006355 [Batrachochytrium dendrobatidis]
MNATIEQLSIPTSLLLDTVSYPERNSSMDSVNIQKLDQDSSLDGEDIELSLMQTFLINIARKTYHEALMLAKEILKLYPQNTLIANYVPVLEERIEQLKQTSQDSKSQVIDHETDTESSDDDSDEESEDSSSEDSEAQSDSSDSENEIENKN